MADTTFVVTTINAKNKNCIEVFGNKVKDGKEEVGEVINLVCTNENILFVMLFRALADLEKERQ